MSFQLSPPAVCQSVSPEDALEDVWRMTFFNLVIPWLGTAVPRGPPKGCSLPSVLSLARLRSNTGGAILPQDIHAQGTGALAGEIRRVFNPWCLSMDAGCTQAGSWTPLLPPGLGGRAVLGEGLGQSCGLGTEMIQYLTDGLPVPVLPGLLAAPVVVEKCVNLRSPSPGTVPSRGQAPWWNQSRGTQPKCVPPPSPTPVRIPAGDFPWGRARCCLFSPFPFHLVPRW